MQELGKRGFSAILGYGYVCSYQIFLRCSVKVRQEKDVSSSRMEQAGK